MSNLSLKEFNKLTEKEKCEKYKDLSEHDRFLVRISMNPGMEVVGHQEVTKEEQEWAEELIKQIEEQEKNKKYK